MMLNRPEGSCSGSESGAGWTDRPGSVGWRHVNGAKNKRSGEIWGPSVSNHLFPSSSLLLTLFDAAICWFAHKPINSICCFKAAFSVQRQRMVGWQRAFFFVTETSHLFSFIPGIVCLSLISSLCNKALHYWNSYFLLLKTAGGWKKNYNKQTHKFRHVTFYQLVFTPHLLFCRKCSEKSSMKLKLNSAKSRIFLPFLSNTWV